MLLHIYQKDETITEIAKRYGLSAVQILEDCGIEDPRHMVPGEILPLFPGEQTHRVRGGEDGLRIAEKYGLSLLQLQRRNPLMGNGTWCYPGQILHLGHGKSECTLFGAFPVGGDRTCLRDALPYVQVLILEGGEMSPAGKIHCPTVPREAAGVMSLCLQMHLPITVNGQGAAALWKAVRQAGGRGLFPLGVAWEEWMPLLHQCKAEGEFLLTAAPHPLSAGVLSSTATEDMAQWIPTLHFTGVRQDEDGNEEALSATAIESMLRSRRAEILRENGIAYTERSTAIGRRMHTSRLCFPDLMNEKKRLDDYIESGVRGICLADVTDLPRKIRCFLGGILG